MAARVQARGNLGAPVGPTLGRGSLAQNRLIFLFELPPVRLLALLQLSKEVNQSSPPFPLGTLLPGVPRLCQCRVLQPADWQPSLAFPVGVIWKLMHVSYLDEGSTVCLALRCST